jgi:hypothetical protein
MIANVSNSARPVVPRWGKCNIDLAVVHLSSGRVEPLYQNQSINMKSLEVEGVTFVRDYTPAKPMSRVDKLAVLMCVSAVLFFVVRLSV